MSEIKKHMHIRVVTPGRTRLYFRSVLFLSVKALTQSCPKGPTLNDLGCEQKEGTGVKSLHI